MRDAGKRFIQTLRHQSTHNTRRLISLCSAGIARPQLTYGEVLAPWVRHPHSRNTLSSYLLSTDNCARRISALCTACNIRAGDDDIDLVQENIDKLDTLHKRGCETAPPVSGLFGLSFLTTIEWMQHILLPKLVADAKQEGLIVIDNPILYIEDSVGVILCNATEQEANTGYSPAPFGTTVSDGVTFAVNFMEKIYNPRIDAR